MCVCVRGLDCVSCSSLTDVLTCRHLSGVVRNRTARHLTSLVEKMGATRILSGGKPSESLTERVLPAITRLAQDSSQEAR